MDFKIKIDKKLIIVITRINSHCKLWLPVKKSKLSLRAVALRIVFFSWKNCLEILHVSEENDQTLFMDSDNYQN
jgi:hypothetical protein